MMAMMLWIMGCPGLVDEPQSNELRRPRHGLACLLDQRRDQPRAHRSAGTPQPVIDKINRAVADALGWPEGKKRLAEHGLDPQSNTPAQAAQFVAAEMAQWAAVVNAAGIKAD
jgi:Tripartite tricarboxylate transporter family receptor